MPPQVVRPYSSGLPTWSPDGKRAAFVIFRTVPELDVKLRLSGFADRPLNVPSPDSIQTLQLALA